MIPGSRQERVLSAIRDAADMGVRGVEVARLGELDRSGRLGVEIDGLRIALLRVGEDVRAVDDFCMRCGCSLLHGPVASGEVACPACGWRYALDTGAVSGMPALRLHTFRVTLDGERVLLEVANPGLG